MCDVKKLLVIFFSLPARFFFLNPILSYYDDDDDLYLMYCQLIYQSNSFVYMSMFVCLFECSSCYYYCRVLLCLIIVDDVDKFLSLSHCSSERKKNCSTLIHIHIIFHF